MASAATEQIQQARASHDRLLSTASESIPESVEDLQAERLSIMAKLKQEVEAKEDMQIELHKMQGRGRVVQFRKVEKGDLLDASWVTVLWSESSVVRK